MQENNQSFNKVKVNFHVLLGVKLKLVVQTYRNVHGNSNFVYKIQDKLVGFVQTQRAPRCKISLFFNVRIKLGRVVQTLIKTPTFLTN